MLIAVPEPNASDDQAPRAALQPAHKLQHRFLAGNNPPRRDAIGFRRRNLRNDTWRWMIIDELQRRREQAVHDRIAICRAAIDSLCISTVN